MNSSTFFTRCSSVSPFSSVIPKKSKLSLILRDLRSNISAFICFSFSALFYSIFFILLNIESISLCFLTISSICSESKFLLFSISIIIFSREVTLVFILSKLTVILSTEDFIESNYDSFVSSLSKRDISVENCSFIAVWAVLSGGGGADCILGTFDSMLLHMKMEGYQLSLAHCYSSTYDCYNIDWDFDYDFGTDAAYFLGWKESALAAVFHRTACLHCFETRLYFIYSLQNHLTLSLISYCLILCLRGSIYLFFFCAFQNGTALDLLLVFSYVFPVDHILIIPCPYVTLNTHLMIFTDLTIYKPLKVI